jgi:hypothetical protein
MANYSLNRTNRVHCSILDENCLANTYTVKFDNGVVRNVPKSKVSNLDRIDEGVLNRLKEVGGKLLDNIVRAAGRYLFCVLGDNVVSNTLFNVMFKAETRKGIGFYPGKTFVAVCDEAGVEPTITEEDDIDDEENRAINAYWREKIAAAQEAETFTDDDIANESYRLSSFAGRMKYNRLFEAEGISLAQPDAGFENVNTKQLQKNLVDQYRAFLFDGVGKPGADTPIPYCIWGAPGVGKTQITKGIITKLQSAGVDANLIVVNARTMRKDDFSLPGVKTDTKRVKSASGKEVTLEMQKAAELIKEWLPMYSMDDTTDEVTADMLDDIMNGGDGSGNGKGGFIFVDELSRVAPDVMEVFMGLVQDRQLGTNYLGSKWMFVFASNRLSDMGDRGGNVDWEAAYTGRFSHLNFVPTFEEWLVWATGKDSNGKQRIEQIIIDFLKEHPNMWYNSAMSNEDTRSEDARVTASMYPQARSWENVSKEMRERKSGNAAFNDKNDPSHDFQKTLYDMLGIEVSDREMNPHEMSSIVRHHAGNKAAQAFASWAGFDARYTADRAAEVWTKGDKAYMSFQINAATMEKAIVKILANHPKYNGKKGTVDITPKEMLNLMKFIIACSEKIDAGTGDTKNQVLTAGYKTLALLLASAPYRIDLSNPADPALDKYDEAIALYHDQVSKNKSNVLDYYDEE